ncbi:MAG: epoxide hydrolase [Halieaceae bacterium]|nr:epoxide hydrolase [Halieaceae bacterium]
MNPFSLHVSDAELDELRLKLKHARFQEDIDNDEWKYGTNGAYLKELVDYWLNEYDWREHEAKINSFDHFRETIDDIPVHFIYEKGKGPNPTPLIMSHGWPWTFWDLQKVIRPLTDPASFGGDPADAFDVIVPSLPGFGFSTPLSTPGINFMHTAEIWDKLMRDVLGYERYGAQGGDWGSYVTTQMGHANADPLLGIHIHITLPLTMISEGPIDPDWFEPDFVHWREHNDRFIAEETGYLAMHTTRPQTVAFALNDSPIGLMSWLLEKRRRWSHCDGDVETRFSKDDLITSVMLYWITQSIGTSMRYYYEAVANPWKPFHDRSPVVEAPTGILLFHNEMVLHPKRWAEQYYNLKSWTEAERGGHFGAMEEPDAIVSDLRNFFRSLR